MFFEQADLNYSFNMSEEDRLTLLDGDWSDSPVETLSRAGFIALSVFLGFIMTFGFLNNLVVLVLFCKFKTLRTPVNMLLLNISVSDMLVCLFGTTLSFASSVRGRWLLGRHGCMWYGFINSCFGTLVAQNTLLRSLQGFCSQVVSGRVSQLSNLITLVTAHH